MRKVLSCLLVMVLLASVVPMVVTPAAAISEVYEKKIPFAGEDNELTKDELVNAILPYMLDEGAYTLDDVGDAAYVYAHWDGKPKTITDMATPPREVTFYRPVERVVSTGTWASRPIFILDGCDKLVGMEYSCINEEVHACGGKLTEIVADVDRCGKNVELVALLQPDVIFGSVGGGASMPHLLHLQETSGAVLVYSPGGSTREQMYRQFRLTGEVLGREEEAEGLISYMEEKVALVTDITSQIDDSDKPRVYVTKHKSLTFCPAAYEAVEIAGGILLNKELGGSGMRRISKEQVVKWNPDVYFIMCLGSAPSLSIEEVLLDPDLQAVNFVKNRTVYYSTVYCRGLPQQRFIPECMYMAKILYPDKFKELDLEKEGNEIFERFYGVDGIYTELADQTFWLREYLDEQQKS